MKAEWKISTLGSYVYLGIDGIEKARLYPTKPEAGEKRWIIRYPHTSGEKSHVPLSSEEAYAIAERAVLAHLYEEIAALTDLVRMRET